MAGLRETKRRALRTALIEAARGRIEADGLDELRARDIARDAGCALGSLYTAFDDIDALILHVNSITLAALGTMLETAAQTTQAPGDKLAALASGYLHFAAGNKNLWSALFDHRMPAGMSVPEWHLQEHAVLFIHIAKPLSTLKPDLAEDDLAIQARTLFSAVHGIVSISLQERTIAVPVEHLDAQLRDFVATVVRGMTSA